MNVYIIATNRTELYYLVNNEIISVEQWSNHTPLEGYTKHPTFVNPYYDGLTNNISSFYETATPEEIYQDKVDQAKAINEDYTARVTKLVGKHIEKFIIENVAIPQEILTERLALISECNFKISELGVIEVVYKQNEEIKK